MFLGNFQKKLFKLLGAVMLMVSVVVPFSLFAASVSGSTDSAEGKAVSVYLLGRDECKFCRAEKEFFNNLQNTRSDIEVVYLNIAKDANAKRLFDTITKTHNVPKITPITVIGTTLIQGFDDEATTGALIVQAIERAKTQPPVTIEEFAALSSVELSGSADAACGGEEEAACSASSSSGFSFKLPLIGVVDLETFSLVSLASILGFVDGFNPCAMWVLVTFLLILMQVGDKRKMWQVAGLFLLAEAVMYFLILNVWYKTWDFIGLDMVVTPAIGILALAGGVYFLRRYAKGRKGGAVCELEDTKDRNGVEEKMKRLVHAPFTLVTALGVIGIAFSVNVIEFACSVGIPQAFTKILEMNVLPTWEHQLYILIYTFFYMLDDIVVFGFALWSFNKIHQSYKYAHYSSLAGGVLMIILGLLMLFAPDMLVF